MNLDLMCYKLWYEESVKPYLTIEGKEAAMKKISNLSLKVPLFTPGLEVDKSKVSELAPYTKLGKYSGRQLLVVLEEIAKELMKNG
jgi:hypothetical protein